MKLISVNDLSLQIEGYFAFKHVAFSLSQNEIIGINGDNGSGKTQLLEAIVSNKTPDSGTIDYTPGVRIGYLPQENPQVIEQSTGKYLEEMRRLSKKLAVRKDQLQAMITYMGLSPYLDTPVNQLSLGLKRQVDFLSAVAGHPNVLVLDEPFAFQSEKTIQRMLDLIIDLKNNNSGIILSATQFDKRIATNFDQLYLLDDDLKNIAAEQKNEPVSLLVFHVSPNSMAITPDVEDFLVSNQDNQIELEVPLKKKQIILNKMVQLNYQFEGMRKIEN
ncbi:ATP-binding cassette domain-containing protein [Companilactobacillus futsaii]|uniref:ATP-binding cassette domain-containing protein n=1 Tax=Companilactobacillus futsaii TaxID=938155 RepID=UPI00189D67BB|nr:ATP-binding cassette domain-containing protein [Companilactobacillus futsaii]